MNRKLLLVCMALGIFGISSAGLPDDLSGLVTSLESQYGGTWGLGAIDLETGQIISSGSRQFTMNVPHLPMTACAIEFSETGILTLDSLIARNEQFWEKLHWSQQGGRGTCQSVLYVMQEERVGSWLSAEGFTGTEVRGVQLDFPDCPQVDPNYITAPDALGFLRIIYENLQDPFVAAMGENPPLSDHNRETLGLGNEIYGWVDQSSDSRLLFVIVDRPRGADYGLVILNDGLSDTADADEGFRALFNEVVH